MDISPEGSATIDRGRTNATGTAQRAARVALEHERRVAPHSRCGVGAAARRVALWDQPPINEDGGRAAGMPGEARPEGAAHAR